MVASGGKGEKYKKRAHAQAYSPNQLSAKRDKTGKRSWVKDDDVFIQQIDAGGNQASPPSSIALSCLSMVRSVKRKTRRADLACVTTPFGLNSMSTTATSTPMTANSAHYKAVSIAISKPTRAHMSKNT